VIVTAHNCCGAPDDHGLDGPHPRLLTGLNRAEAEPFELRVARQRKLPRQEKRAVTVGKVGHQLGRRDRPPILRSRDARDGERRRKQGEAAHWHQDCCASFSALATASSMPPTM
jgi:hypothetical protein